MTGRRTPAFLTNIIRRISHYSTVQSGPRLQSNCQTHSCNCLNDFQKYSPVWHSFNFCSGQVFVSIINATRNSWADVSHSRPVTSQSRLLFHSSCFHPRYFFLLHEFIAFPLNGLCRMQLCIIHRTKGLKTVPNLFEYDSMRSPKCACWPL